ncbi:MAG: hypothetical protein ACKO1N_00170 [Erythrobacter sp.]
MQRRILLPAGLAVACCALALAIQWSRLLNHDVAYLVWVADRMVGGAVFGVDIREINPPMSALLYLPAALAAPLAGLDQAVKLWIGALFALALIVLGRVAAPELRLPLVAAVGLFVALAFPREFGQRDQIALLFLLPYSFGPGQTRGWQLSSGILAGLAVCIKPHFLLVVIAAFALRRRTGPAEWAIGFTGLTYGAVLLAFFQPYLSQMLPQAREGYSGIIPRPEGFEQARVIAIYLVMVSAIALLGRDRRLIGPMLMALAFFAVVLLQGKLFHYHFIPVWGAMLAALVTLTTAPLPRSRVYAGLGLLLVVYWVGSLSLSWYRDGERREALVPQLLSEIDRAQDFLVISDYPFPAFPTAIYSARPYRGVGACNMALAAVARLESGQDLTINPKVRQLAAATSTAELRSLPDLVIVNSNWSGFSRIGSGQFDGLAWLDQQDEFHRIWQNYRETGRVGTYRLFRRATPRPSSSPEQ